MKKLIEEFKAFVSKGNVMDLAVGVIIGGAFKTIVDALVGDVISPVLGLVANTHLENLSWQIGEVKIGYGAFITAVINFLLMAIVLFLIIKGIDRAQALGKKMKKPDEPEAPAAPTTKICPYCKSEIPVEATRCAHCTSELTD